MTDQPGNASAALGNQGGPFPLFVRGQRYDLAYPDLRTLAEFVNYGKGLALAGLDLARRHLSPEGFAAYAGVVNAEMGVKRMYEWGGQRCLETLLSGDGLVRFTWLLLRPHQPNLTEADAARVVRDALEDDPGETDQDGSPVRNPYLLQTLLDLADPGKSQAPTAGTAPSP